MRLGRRNLQDPDVVIEGLGSRRRNCQRCVRPRVFAFRPSVSSRKELCRYEIEKIATVPPVDQSMLSELSLAIQLRGKPSSVKFVTNHLVRSSWENRHLVRLAAHKRTPLRRIIHSIPDRRSSYDVPDILTGMAELAAGHTRAETVIAYTDRIVLERIGKIIPPLRHSTHKHADALLGTQRLDIILHPDDRRVETERYLAAVGRQVVCDRVLDDLQQLLLRVR